MTVTVLPIKPSRLDVVALFHELAVNDPHVTIDVNEESLTVHSAAPADHVRAVADRHKTADHAAEFAAAVGAIDTSKVADPAAKVALDAIKAVLIGGKGPGAQARRPEIR